MKFYPSDNLTPVNSSARKAKRAYIPVFNYDGAVEAVPSDPWSPYTTIALTGGYTLVSKAGATTLDVQILKGNKFEKNIIIAEALLAANDKKTLFTLSSKISGDYIITPYDYIIVNPLSASGHEGLVVQLLAEEVY